MENLNPYNPETEPASYKWFNEKPQKENGAEHQARQPVRKTLDECKDEVARSYGYEDWASLRRLKTAGQYIGFTASTWEYIAELYASQAKAVEPQEGWVDVKTDPKSGIYNLAFSTDTGRHIAWWDNVSGWKDRSGYKLKDVTHYMPLPEPPTQTNN